MLGHNISNPDTNKGKLKSQIEHIIIKKAHLHSDVTHAFATHSPLVHSDHRHIRVKLNMAMRSRRKRGSGTTMRTRIVHFLNSHTEPVEDDDNRKVLINYRRNINNNIANGSATPATLYKAIQKAVKHLTTLCQNPEPQWPKHCSKTLDQLIAIRESAKKLVQKNSRDSSNPTQKPFLIFQKRRYWTAYKEHQSFSRV